MNLELESITAVLPMLQIKDHQGNGRPSQPITLWSQKVRSRCLMTLVLVRHGESQANVDHCFSGWFDTDLTDKGKREAYFGASILKSANLVFDFAYTSTLKRAIRTLWINLDVIDQMACPYECFWRLNEVHYGSFTNRPYDGIDKDTVRQWRSSFHYRPPPIPPGSEYDPFIAPKYAGLDRSVLPLSESLAMMWERAFPVWTERIYRDLTNRKTILIAGHGDLLRAIMKHIEGLTPDEIMARNVLPNGRPFLYRFDQQMNIIEKQLLPE